MKRIDCSWERRNLNSEVTEITIESMDKFCDFRLSSYSDKEYVVVKVPVNMPDFIFGLSNLGFAVIELQMDMSVKLSEFNFDDRLLKWVRPHTNFRLLESTQELDELIHNITSDMFSTDRISIDPFYGPVVGCNRYINWITDEFEKNSSKLIWVIYKNIKVGFMMYKEGPTIRGLLGGLFMKYQDAGLGLLTPCSLPLYVKQNELPTQRLMANISSNNISVWELYQHFGYKVTSPHYVFIKHL